MKSFGFVLFVLAAAASSVAAMPAGGDGGIDIRDMAIPRDFSDIESRAKKGKGAAAKGGATATNNTATSTSSTGVNAAANDGSGGQAAASEAAEAVALSQAGDVGALTSGSAFNAAQGAAVAAGGKAAKAN